MAGRSPTRRWRFAGRFSTVAGTLSTAGVWTRVFVSGGVVTGLLLVNKGTASVFLSDREAPGAVDNEHGFELEPGDSLAPSAIPWGPENDLFAAGAAGADLRVLAFEQS